MFKQFRAIPLLPALFLLISVRAFAISPPSETLRTETSLPGQHLPHESTSLTITVLDDRTGIPVEGASVTTDATVNLTGPEGTVTSYSDIQRLLIRSPGYKRAEGNPAVDPVIRLTPFEPKALYLSFWGAGDSRIRGTALDLIEKTELNSLVIDVKGDMGQLSYRSTLPMAEKINVQRYIPVKDLPGLIRSLHDKGIYTIARIVTFKDDPLAEAYPELAVRTSDGKIFRDREGLRWVDPFSEIAWDYNIAIAEEVARHGFDEIQFDYVRFPDRAGLVFSRENIEKNRIEAISRFLAKARERLIPHNVFISADIFGYACWNLNDTEIGQRIDTMAPHVDYIAPMLYPSGFQYGVGPYKKAVAYPYEVIYLSLENARKRSGLSPCRFRPWLQAFRDYAFDRRPFGPHEVTAQIKASRDFGSNGWMLWNASNKYDAEDLKEPASSPTPAVATEKEPIVSEKEG